MELKLRSRRLCLDENGFNDWRTCLDTRSIAPANCALILCDVWDRHWCRGANARLAPMLPGMARLIDVLRSAGVLIIHAPSETLDFYANTPAYKRALDYPQLTPEVVDFRADPPQPIDASDGGSDSNEPADMLNRIVWTRQHEAIHIDQSRDIICDDGRKIFSCLKAEGIADVFIMGVHTNMCILNRSFGIKSLVRWGFHVALVRDMTDLMYNPALPPYVSHAQGLELIIRYIEQFWCQTVSSSELLDECD